MPLWQQYLDFWKGVLTGNMGGSIYAPGATVTSLVFSAMPYTLALLVPAVLLSYVLGNRLGAAAARRKFLDNSVLPLGYILQSIPYPWLALVIPYLFGVVWHLFPTSFGYDQGLVPHLRLDVHRLPARPLVPAVPHRVPREPRRPGDRHAEPDHLRA